MRVIRKEKRKEKRPDGKVENAMKLRFPLSHRARYQKQKETTGDRTQTPKEGGLRTAAIDDKPETEPAVSSCRDPAVLVDAGQHHSAARIALSASVALFIIYGIDFAVNDSFAPLRYVTWARAHPGTRLVPFSPNEAPCIVDRIAGPHDKIAIDSGFASWIYPAFGRDLTRPVQLLTGRGPLMVDSDARWVVIDRTYEAVWYRPAYRDLSQAFSLSRYGTLSPEGKLFLQQALALPGFRPLYVNLAFGQAVLVRR
jgi:hypothetical protein